MRSRKQTPSDLNGDHVDVASEAADPTPGDALTLAEEAEAEAAEAEAVAAAARARAKALRLRREAEATKAAEAAEAAKTAKAAEAVEEDASAETDAPAEAEADATEAEAGLVDEADKPDDAAAEGEKPVAAEPRGLRIRIPIPSWKVVAASLTVLIIAALVTCSVLMFIGHKHALAEQQRRAEFAAAARQGVVTLMSLDYNRAKEDVQRIIDNSTGQFKQDFQNTADDFIKVATDSKAVTETNVTATGVESMTNDTAVVIVAATSRVTNAAGAKQEPRAWRLSVNLARDGGQIKMAKVEFVP
jgi:Mce-associated membrane protein